MTQTEHDDILDEFAKLFTHEVREMEYQSYQFYFQTFDTAKFRKVLSGYYRAYLEGRVEPNKSDDQFPKVNKVIAYYVNDSGLYRKPVQADEKTEDEQMDESIGEFADWPREQQIEALAIMIAHLKHPKSQKMIDLFKAEMADEDVQEAKRQSEIIKQKVSRIGSLPYDKTKKHSDHEMDLP